MACRLRATRLIASPTTVVREVNVPAFEKLMIKLMNQPTPPAPKQ
ncbi:hypothetical protein [Collimonas antrihumi]|nr:hypothetical protein [Collimonas antrihumi]